MAAQLSSLTTVWFIDYRLKRKTTAPTWRQAWRSERMFYGSDRRFVEVMGAFDMDYDTWEVVSEEEGSEIALEPEREDISLAAMNNFIVAEPWDLTLPESEDEGEYSPGAYNSHDEDSESSSEESDLSSPESESGTIAYLAYDWLFRGDWFIYRLEETIMNISGNWVTKYFNIPASKSHREGARFGLLACEYF
ncbi:hypothetical protein ACHAQJ_003124 [Trichoderma viride]